MRRTILTTALSVGVAISLAWTALAPVGPAHAERPTASTGLGAALPERLYPFRRHHGLRGYNRPYVGGSPVKVEPGALSGALPTRLFPFRNGNRALPVAGVPVGGLYGGGAGFSAPTFNNNVVPSIVTTNSLSSRANASSSVMSAPQPRARPDDAGMSEGGLSLSIVEGPDSDREDVIDYGEISADPDSVRTRHWRLRGSTNHAHTFDRIAERGGSLSRTLVRRVAAREARRLNRASGSLIEAINPQLKELAEERDYIRELKGKGRNKHITYLGFDD